MSEAIDTCAECGEKFELCPGVVLPLGWECSKCRSKDIKEENVMRLNRASDRSSD